GTTSLISTRQLRKTERQLRSGLRFTGSRYCCWPVRIPATRDCPTQPVLFRTVSGKPGARILDSPSGVAVWLARLHLSRRSPLNDGREGQADAGILLSVLQWRYANESAKEVSKIALIAETQLLAEIRNRYVSCRQQGLRLL